MIAEAAGLRRAPAAGVRFTPAQTWVQRFATDALVAAATIAGAAAARIGIEQWTGGVAPFILTFPAVMIATLLRGGQAGAISALGCQLLTIRYVFPNWISTHGGLPTDLANVVLSTLALGGTVWATASYRHAAGALRSRCEQQVHTLSLLISEMDHRTKNNFQIAAGLLGHQSVSAFNPELARELDKAATRLEAIASVYESLSLTSADERRVDLEDHLRRIVARLRAGATPEHVALTYQADHVTVSAETAIIVGLIVNEWVTNAVKHAFGESPGCIAVKVARRGDRVTVSVHDDGGAICPVGQPGRGSELMSSLAEVVNARLAVDGVNGRRCSLTLPCEAGGTAGGL